MQLAVHAPEMLRDEPQRRGPDVVKASRARDCHRMAETASWRLGERSE
jgi:hypothetical protein